MKAMVLRAFGQPLELAEMPRPQVGPAEVLVRVRACGIGLTVVNLLATPGRVTAYPRIPGHEIEHPMAIVILGGLLTSTLLNLFVMPVLYHWVGMGKSGAAVRE